MEEAFNKLMALQSQPMSSVGGTGASTLYGERFDSFFKEMKSLTASGWTLPNFEASLIATLFPIAPHLIKLINLQAEDIERLERGGGFVGLSSSSDQGEGVGGAGAGAKLYRDDDTDDEDGGDEHPGGGGGDEEGGGDSDDQQPPQQKLPQLVPVNYL